MAYKIRIHSFFTTQPLPSLKHNKGFYNTLGGLPNVVLMNSQGSVVPDDKFIELSLHKGDFELGSYSSSVDLGRLTFGPEH